MAVNAEGTTRAQGLPYVILPIDLTLAVGVAATLIAAPSDLTKRIRIMEIDLTSNAANGIMTVASHPETGANTTMFVSQVSTTNRWRDMSFAGIATADIGCGVEITSTIIARLTGTIRIVIEQGTNP